MRNSDPPENITEAILPDGAELPPRPWRAQDSGHSFWEVVDSTGFVIRGLGCIYSKDLEGSSALTGATTAPSTMQCTGQAGPVSLSRICAASATFGQATRLQTGIPFA
jgi:hypothetical protein